MPTKNEYKAMQKIIRETRWREFQIESQQRRPPVIKPFILQYKLY
jgi:hypothetical protein